MKRTGHPKAELRLLTPTGEKEEIRLLKFVTKETKNTVFLLGRRVFVTFVLHASLFTLTEMRTPQYFSSCWLVY